MPWTLGRDPAQTRSAGLGLGQRCRPGQDQMCSTRCQQQPREFRRTRMSEGSLLENLAYSISSGTSVAAEYEHGIFSACPCGQHNGKC